MDSKTQVASIPLLVGNSHQSVASGLCRIHGIRNLLEHGLNETPLISTQRHNCDFAVLQVLLVYKIFVGCEQEIESSVFSGLQQLAIQKSTPSLLIGSSDDVSLQTFPDTQRSSLIE